MCYMYTHEHAHPNAYMEDEGEMAMLTVHLEGTISILLFLNEKVMFK